MGVVLVVEAEREVRMEDLVPQVYHDGVHACKGRESTEAEATQSYDLKFIQS